MTDFYVYKNSTENTEIQRKLANGTGSSTLSVTGNVFEPLNTTTYRLIVYTNGSSTVTTTLVFTCKPKGNYFRKIDTNK